MLKIRQIFNRTVQSKTLQSFWDSTKQNLCKVSGTAQSKTCAKFLGQHKAKPVQSFWDSTKQNLCKVSGTAQSKICAKFLGQHKAKSVQSFWDSTKQNLCKVSGTAQSKTWAKFLGKPFFYHWKELPQASFLLWQKLFCANIYVCCVFFFVFFFFCNKTFVMTNICRG